MLPFGISFFLEVKTKKGRERMMTLFSKIALSTWLIFDEYSLLYYS